MIATHSVHLVALPFSRSIDVPNHECSKTHKCPVWSRVLAFSRCAAAVDCCLARAAHDRNQTSSAYPAARVSDCNMPGDESFPCSPSLPGPLPIRQDPWGARRRRPGKASAAAALPNFADSHDGLAEAEPLCAAICQSSRHYWSRLNYSGRCEPSSVATNVAGEILDGQGQKQAREQTGRGYAFHVGVGSLGPVSSLLVHRWAAGSIPRVQVDADGTMPRVTTQLDVGRGVSLATRVCPQPLYLAVIHPFPRVWVWSQTQKANVTRWAGHHSTTPRPPDPLRTLYRLVPHPISKA